jgi:hypothetical protein
MCEEQNGMDHEAVRERLKTVRALIKSARERVPALRPAWGAHLAAETLARLSTSIDRLEEEIGMTGAEEREPSAHRAPQP